MSTMSDVMYELYKDFEHFKKKNISLYVLIERITDYEARLYELKEKIYRELHKQAG